MRLRLCTQAHPGHEGGEGINATRDPVTLPRSRRGRHHRREAAFVQQHVPGEAAQWNSRIFAKSLGVTVAGELIVHMLCVFHVADL